ncbi:GDSL-type esterase/lipase family protein [Gordonia sp. CPCC 205515]|uniref:GDSL-type esterase/lipase family protein n=1 Tax=Gordonia sp. CPCC 205515 TaxID=3140791 RepID=UPI003AF34E41
MLTAGCLLTALTGTVTATPAIAAPECGGEHFVASWAASPTDALTPLDASGGVIPLAVRDQTFRMIITPHFGGDRLRVRLSNRFGSAPITFDRSTVAAQVHGAQVGATTPLRFGGRESVTVAPGADILSDPIAHRAKAFRPLAISVFVPGNAGPPTKHWNANATSYYSPPGTGDLTRRRAATGYTASTKSWFYVDALDVSAPHTARTVVAFGDSITDGFVGTTGLSVPADTAVADRNVRYPDFLQHRLDQAHLPISVVNAGIGSNRLLTSGEPLLLGPRGLSRFRRDALQQSGVAGVLLLEGINDLGFPPGATAEQMIAGFRQAIAEAHRAGVAIWLGTIVPASDALVDGTVIAPSSERYRQQINAWIRTQKLADGFVDFDVALRDPRNPTVMAHEYSSPDRLHPSPDGYRAMARAVDLAMLSTARSPRC